MICQNCGKKISKNSKFCKYCGSVVPNIGSEPKKKGSYNLLLLSIQIILFLIFFLALKDVKAFSMPLFNFYKFLHLPFQTLFIDKLQIILPPYFIYNFIIVLIFAIILIKKVSPDIFQNEYEQFTKIINKVKKVKINASKGKKEETIKKPIFLIVFLTLMFLILYCLVYLKQLFIVQDILFILCFFIIGKYFYNIEKRDIINNIKVVEKKEFISLFLFTLVALILYVFDWRSWKYIYVGDEYAFYYFAKFIAEGKVPLKMLYEDGVYNHHPFMASLYQAILMFLTGKSYIGWRLSSTIIPVLGIIPFYLWVRLLFNKDLAVLATASYTFALPLMSFARIPHDIIHAVFPFILTMFLIEIAIRKNSYFYTFLGAIFAGFCFYTFQTARLILPVGFFYWLFHPLRKQFSLKKVFVGALIFVLFILPIVVGGMNSEDGNFFDKMLIHTFVKAKEVRPINNNFAYMVANFIHAFFSFMINNNISHYVPFPLLDILSSIGVILGFAYLIVYFGADWRSKFLSFSFLTSIFVIGSIHQYVYPPNTRLNFLVIIFSILAAIGLIAIISLLRNYKIFKLNKKIMVYSFSLIIIFLNLYLFFIQMPLKANFSAEAIGMKFVEENKNKKTIIVSEILHDLPSIMKNHFYDENVFEKIDLNEFKIRLAEDKLKGINILFCYDIGKKYPELNDLITKGKIIYPKDNMRYYYLFDLSNEQNYTNFKQMFVEKIGQEEIEKVILSKNTNQANNGESTEGKIMSQVTQKTERQKIKFQFPKLDLKFDLSGIFCKTTPRYIILKQNIYAQILKLNSELKSPIDIAVSQEGDILYISDAQKNAIEIFERKNDIEYSLIKTIQLNKRKQDKIQEGLIYFDIDKNGKKLFVVDCIYGTLSEYSTQGQYLRTLTKNGYLMGTRSIEYKSINNQEYLITSVPPNAGFVIYDSEGKIIKSLLDRPGKKCNEFDQPCFALLDSALNIYLYDTGNLAIKKLNFDLQLKKAIIMDGSSTIFGPQFVINENSEKPYLVATIQNSNLLKIYSLDWKKCLIIRFGEEGLPRFLMPTAITQDKNGVLYIISPQEKMVIKVKLPEKIF